jgi:hypothetical protein
MKYSLEENPVYLEENPVFLEENSVWIPRPPTGATLARPWGSATAAAAAAAAAAVAGSARVAGASAAGRRPHLRGGGAGGPCGARRRWRRVRLTAGRSPALSGLDRLAPVYLGPGMARPGTPGRCRCGRQPGCRKRVCR